MAAAFHDDASSIGDFPRHEFGGLDEEDVVLPVQDQGWASDASETFDARIGVVIEGRHEGDDFLRSASAENALELAVGGFRMDRRVQAVQEDVIRQWDPRQSERLAQIPCLLACDDVLYDRLVGGDEALVAVADLCGLGNVGVRRGRGSGVGRNQAEESA